MISPIVWIVLLFILVFIVAIAIGANDETMASVVGGKVLKLNVAIFLGMCLQIIGAQLLGAGVSETIGQDMVLTPLSFDIVLILAIAMTIWLLVASLRGYPISTTHSIVGCVLGIGLLIELFTSGPLINWATMSEIVIGWILSPIFGLLIAFLIQTLVKKAILPRAKSLDTIERLEKIFGWFLLAMVVITALSRGGNDVSKAVGILTMIFPDPAFWSWFLLLGGCGMALGLFLIGRRVVATVGMEVTELRPSTSFSAEAAVATVLLVGTIWGIPLSGTHVLVAAVVGVGIANHNPVRGPGLNKIIIASFLTVPLSALLAVGLFWLYVAIKPFFLVFGVT
ncbi:MAG: inorganic phosphate transporter [Candidatus Thorarchaeota archaeon]